MLHILSTIQKTVWRQKTACIFTKYKLIKTEFYTQMQKLYYLHVVYLYRFIISVGKIKIKGKAYQRIHSKYMKVQTLNGQNARSLSAS